MSENILKKNVTTPFSVEKGIGLAYTQFVA